jgi:formylmethanofuran dehydrogenase subunit B
MSEHPNVACTLCGCVCDDLTLEVEGGRIVRAERACHLSEPWLLAQGSSSPPVALIEGSPADFEEALNRAGALLREARSPLIYGLSRSNTEGQAEATALADLLGATIDTTASRGHAPSIVALQQAGESTCTLGEVRNRADLVIFWGSDPLESHPRHLERYALDPPGEFVPAGRAGRTLVVADVKRTATASLADQFLPIEPGQDFEALWALRSLVKGVEPEAGSALGAAREDLQKLAWRMKTSKVGAIFFGLGLSRQGGRVVEALLRLVTDLNDHTRFYARRMRVSGDVAGADSVLAWQTGYPFSVNLARGYPRHNPGEFSAHDMLLRGEVDGCLLVGSHGLRRFEPAVLERLRALPLIVLDGPGVECPLPPAVRFTTAVPGVHTGGTVYRLDEVPIPLRAVLPSIYPTDAEVLRGLRLRCGQGLTRS